jgi:hypothetical protein
VDSLITAAAQALAKGDPLGALQCVALRDDAPALALRGIAMAQLGEYGRARTLLRNAARKFGAKEALARARCIVAEAEVALASRDLHWPARMLEGAQTTLAEHGDRENAAHARYLELRHRVLIGDLDTAAAALGHVDPRSLPVTQQVVHELIVASIAMRRVQARIAREALARARQAAGRAGIPALIAEVDGATLMLDAPVARVVARDRVEPLKLADVEALVRIRCTDRGRLSLRDTSARRGDFVVHADGTVLSGSCSCRSVASRCLAQ